MRTVTVEERHVQRSVRWNSLQLTVEAVKLKLQTHCGTSPSSMVLEMKDHRGEKLATLAPDSRKLGYFSPLDG